MHVLDVLPIPSHQANTHTALHTLQWKCYILAIAFGNERDAPNVCRNTQPSRVVNHIILAICLFSLQYIIIHRTLVNNKLLEERGDVPQNVSASSTKKNRQVSSIFFHILIIIPPSFFFTWNDLKTIFLLGSWSSFLFPQITPVLGLLLWVFSVTIGGL